MEIHLAKPLICVNLEDFQWHKNCGQSLASNPHFYELHRYTHSPGSRKAGHSDRSHCQQRKTGPPLQTRAFLLGRLLKSPRSPGGLYCRASCEARPQLDSLLHRSSHGRICPHHLCRATEQKRLTDELLDSVLFESVYKSGFDLHLSVKEQGIVSPSSDWPIIEPALTVVESPKRHAADLV